MFLETFETTNVLKFGIHSKILNCSPSSAPCLHLHVRPKTRLNACILRLNVVSDLASRGMKTSQLSPHVLVYMLLGNFIILEKKTENSLKRKWLKFVNYDHFDINH